MAVSRLRMGCDGEGIRTLIAVKGCPLRCRYCLNPFTWDGSEKGKLLTAQEIYEKVRLDRPYMLATNGGITFGGGEPLLYPELISEFRRICDPELTIYAETSLNVPIEKIKDSMEAVDRFIVDIKTADKKIYLDYTGGDSERVFENLRYLLDMKGSDHITVRIPVIPGFTDKADCSNTGRILHEMGVKDFEYFRYTVPKQVIQ